MAHTPFKGTVGRRVQGAGPREAEVVILAEAPGENEEKQGAPLVGASGQFLFGEDTRGVESHIWPGIAELGLGRDVVRLENVLEVRPLDNDLDTISLAAMRKWQEDCLRRLGPEHLPNLKYVIPLGNPALNTILRSPLRLAKKRGGGAEWKWPQTISAWRGSVNEVELGGRKVTMIPTFHPAHFLYGGGMNFQAWRADWIRIGKAAREGIEVWPRLTTIVGPTWREIELFGKLIQHTWHREGKGALLAFDIETIGPIIDCVGFCVDGETTLTIPLLPQLWAGGKADVKRAWDVVRSWIEHDIPKGTWWGYYDVYRLERQKGWKVKRWWWDGYNLHNMYDPADEHSLSYCASRDLQLPYWKHWGKAERRGPDRALRADWRRRHEYNGYDVGATWQLIRLYQAQLTQGWGPLWQGFAA